MVEMKELTRESGEAEPARVRVGSASGKKAASGALGPAAGTELCWKWGAGLGCWSSQPGPRPILSGPCSGLVPCGAGWMRGVRAQAVEQESQVRSQLIDCGAPGEPCNSCFLAHPGPSHLGGCRGNTRSGRCGLGRGLPPPGPRADLPGHLSVPLCPQASLSLPTALPSKPPPPSWREWQGRDGTHSPQVSKPA